MIRTKGDAIDRVQCVQLIREVGLTTEQVRDDQAVEFLDFAEIFMLGWMAGGSGVDGYWGAAAAAYQTYCAMHLSERAQ